MNIIKLNIKNYKSIKDSGEIIIDDKIMSFIGQNNAGKSAILDAIQCAFPSAKRPFPEVISIRGHMIILRLLFGLME